MVREKSKTEERRQQIKKLLLTNNVVSIGSFCSLLNCSESTIRNDLKYMNENGLITRTYGGAVLNENTRYNISMNVRYEMHIAEKEALAQYIVEHILVNNSTITLDSGTTMVAIAKKILASSLELTVITSSFAVAEVLSRTANIDLYLAGGRLNHIKEAFIDQNSIDFISTMSSDLYLLSCDGIDVKKGVTIGAPEEVAIKAKMAENAKKTICVVDGSKIGRVKLKEIFPIETIQQLVTTSSADKTHIAAIEAAGLPVTLVAETSSEA